MPHGGAIPPPGAGVAQAQRIVSTLGAAPEMGEAEKHGRDRQTDTALRAAIERGGNEANTAM
eukprot:4956049-Amphidinium_carterae.1